MVVLITRTRTASENSISIWWHSANQLCYCVDCCCMALNYCRDYGRRRHWR